jgi:hypothetical protein
LDLWHPCWHPAFIFSWVIRKRLGNFSIICYGRHQALIIVIVRWQSNKSWIAWVWTHKWGQWN